MIKIAKLSLEKHELSLTIYIIKYDQQVVLKVSQESQRNIYSIRPKQNIFNVTSEPTQPYCYCNFFNSSCFTSILENFVSFS